MTQAVRIAYSGMQFKMRISAKWNAWHQMTRFVHFYSAAKRTILMRTCSIKA